MKKNKSGFTLIELLAVIVILAVILVISIPRILDVIETSKKDSFKNAAQLIADSAEKKKASNKLLDKDESIACKDVAKINIDDYGNCIIKFDENGTAKVSISGKGKFEGLVVVNGTKTSAEVVRLESPEYGVATTYIENLYNDEALRMVNGLKKDNTEDTNIRYYGANPNNYVSFNNELWRIIGVFNDNVKLIRKDSLGWLSWDTSDESVNGGYGINQWGESTYEDGTTYEGSDLMQYLNKMYYGGTSVTCYNRENNTTTTCPKDSKGKFLKLDETSKSLIDNHTWNTAGVDSNDVYDSTTYISDTSKLYKAERGTKTGKNCTSGNWCNDTVTRTTTWTGYVALPYVTDWAYASENEICETNYDAYDNDFLCKKNNWTLNEGIVSLLSPYTDSNNANLVFGVDTENSTNLGSAGDSSPIIPAIYLKSNVLIESGAGTSSNPYILKLSS